MLGFNLISGSGVETQGIEGIVELMGGARCGTRGLGSCKGAQHEESCCEPHGGSVVTKGVVEQEYGGAGDSQIAFANGTRANGEKFKA